MRAYGVRIERTDGGPMVLPGLDGARIALVLTVTAKGIRLTPPAPELSEDTARALANALLITFGMKLTKGG